jgi:hypothetical protein
MFSDWSFVILASSAAVADRCDDVTASASALAALRGSLRGFRASGEFIRVPFARGLHALEFFSLGRELRLKRQ